VSWVDYCVVVSTGDPLAATTRDNWETVRNAVPPEKIRTVILPDSALLSLDFAAARNLALQHVPDGDFVMILDADEVHYPDWESICQYYLVNGADSITAAFYHFVCFRDAVQAVFPREIVFRKYPDTQFVGKVHEQLHTTRRNPVTADYRYCHFSYLRPQPNVFERWRRYSVIEGEPHHYDGQSPEHIIDDRVSVATRFTLDYPPTVQDVIEDYPVCPVPLQGESEPDPPKVGLALLAKNDAELLPRCLETLRTTYGHFDVAAIDVGSTDNSQTLLAQEAAEPRAGGRLELLGVLEANASLAVALNTGFNHLRENGYDYIGWIHPDMRFDDPEWLTGLLHELRCWPKVGKVCAANTRDPIPEAIIDGHEQCYLIRRHVLDEIGLFDESFVGIGGYEDWDMNRRILNAGYRVVITPRAQVFHQGMATRSRRDTTAEQERNRDLYLAKWGTLNAAV
jgi:GT2 family glycosyltransferase